MIFQILKENRGTVNIILLIWFLIRMIIKIGLKNKWRVRWYFTKKQQKEKFPNTPNKLPLEGDEKLEEGTGIKTLTPNKLLTRLPGLLAQIKVGQYSYKIKNKIR